MALTLIYRVFGNFLSGHLLRVSSNAQITQAESANYTSTEYLDGKMDPDLFKSCISKVQLVQNSKF